MPCGCCCFNSDETIEPLRKFNQDNPNPCGRGYPDDFKEEKTAWKVKWERFGKEFLKPLYIALHETVAKVSREHGVHHVFARRPEKWEVLGKMPGILMVEGNELYPSITKWYGEFAAGSFSSHWKQRD